MFISDINKCDSAPCRNAGICEDRMSEFVCNCPNPYFGDMCENSVRLVGGQSDTMGRVGIFHDGVWGNVCDDGWDDTDANVVCRQLGFGAGVAMIEAHFGEGTGQIWLDDVSCAGSESHLVQCSHSEWGIHNCKHGEDASVICNS